MKRNLFLLAALFCLFLVFAACTRQPIRDSDSPQGVGSGLSDRSSDSTDRNVPIISNSKTDENEVGWDDPVSEPVSDPSDPASADPSSSDRPSESTDSSQPPSEPPVHTESRPNTETNYSTVIK